MLKNYSEIFNSLSAFNSALNSRPLNTVFKNVALSSHREGSDFSGTESYEEATKLMLTGDAENMKNMCAISGINVSKMFGEKKRNICTKTVSGGFPLVPLYLTGTPKCMMSQKKVALKTKVISIFYSISANGGTDKNDMIKAGAKIASIIRYLEAKNIRINLYVGDGAIKSGQQIDWAIKIKDSGAPLNFLNIVYPLVNPSMLRRHFFALIEKCPVQLEERFFPGYGGVAKFDENSELIKKIGREVVVLNYYNVVNADVKEIIKNIINKIAM